MEPKELEPEDTVALARETASTLGVDIEEDICKYKEEMSELLQSHHRKFSREISYVVTTKGVLASKEETIEYLQSDEVVEDKEKLVETMADLVRLVSHLAENMFLLLHFGEYVEPDLDADVETLTKETALSSLRMVLKEQYGVDTSAWGLECQ